MDDERRAIGIEQPAVAFETRTDEVQRRAADLVGFDHEIGQVAMMRAHRIFAAMLRAGRVPVRARAREVGRRALADAMDVHTISAGTEAACDELDAQERKSKRLNSSH